MGHAIYNGKIIDETKATVSVMDKGYFFDFAVYSSLKVVQGKIFFADYHISRLMESAKLLDLDHPFKKADILSWLESLVNLDKLQDSFIRITLIGAPEDSNQAKLFIGTIGNLTFYPDKLYKHGAKVITYKGERRVPKSKNKELLMSFLANREAQKVGALEALFIDNEDNVREGTRTNFFAIKDQTIFTPPSEKVLGGITKKIILDVTREDFDIKEQDIALGSISDYDELFISSTTMNVMPIGQLDDLIFDTKFEKTHQIAKLFKDYYDKNVFDK